MGRAGLAPKTTLSPSLMTCSSCGESFRNLLFLTNLLTNRIAQIDTNHHKHTQPTVWNDHAAAFIIQFSRFRNCPAEAVAVRRSGNQLIWQEITAMVALALTDVNARYIVAAKDW